MNFFKKLFSSNEEPLEDLVPNAEKLEIEDKNIYVVNHDYLVEIEEIKESSEQHRYRISTYREFDTTNPTHDNPPTDEEKSRWFKQESLEFQDIEGDKKDAFLKACDRVSDRILKNEGIE